MEEKTACHSLIPGIPNVEGFASEKEEISETAWKQDQSGEVGRIEHSPSKKEMQLYNDVWSLFIGQVSSKERKREEGVKKSTRTSEIFGRQVKRVSTTLHTSSQLTHT